GRVEAVALGYRDEQVGCEQVVCATPAAAVIPLLPVQPPRRLALAAEATPALHRFLLHLVAPLEALPDALGPLAYSVRDPAAPLPMDPLWSLPAPRPLGLCGFAHSTGVKNLLLASRQILPGLGFEGELVAGWVATRIVSARLGRREVDKTELLSG